MFDVVMDAPGKNALGADLLTWLLERIREGNGKPLLLTGTGDSFSAGLNLKEIVRMDGGAMEAFLRLLEAVCTALYAYPGPTVAAVNGHAIAGGAVLAACCDCRVAQDDPRIKIGLNEVALGLRFPPAILRIVRARVPHRHVETIVLGAGLHPPRIARDLGLVDEVADDALVVARQRLATLASYPADAYAANKADLRGALSSTPEEERRFLNDVLPSWTSDTVRERIARLLAR